MNNSIGSPEFAGLQKALVEKLILMGCITSPHVAEAFRTVPRHFFTPGVALEKVYSDSSIPTKRADGKLVSSSSQPAVMAIMLEQLQLQPGHRILEIGAGTGFNAGLMAHLVGKSGQVVTVDIDEDIVEGAREHLRSAGLDNVKVICGDGGMGYANDAPYDRIILTVGSWDIVPAWWEQLKPGGRLVLPLEIKGGIQSSIAFDKKDAYLESVSVSGCSFISLRGAFSRPPNIVPLGPEPGLAISADEVVINGDQVYRLLCGPSEDFPSGVQGIPGEVIYGGLGLWLSLHEPHLCVLSSEGELANRGIVPCFLTIQTVQKLCVTGGLLGDEELCVFVRHPEPGSSSELTANPQSFEFFVRSYGRGTRLAKQLIDQTRAWHAAGRPSSKGLPIRAYLKDYKYLPAPDEFVIPKRWTNLVLKWK